MSPRWGARERAWLERGRTGPRSIAVRQAPTLSLEDRLAAAAEQLRGQARGGEEAFRVATAEYDLLVGLVGESAGKLSVATVATSTGLSHVMIQRLRREARGQ